MGYQVIKQPDGQLAIWSTYSDDFIYFDATKDEVIEFFVDRAEQEARMQAFKVVQAVVNDRPREVYSQFAMTWDEAQIRQAEVHGE